MDTREMLRQSWRAWISRGAPRVGPWWDRRMPTTLVADDEPHLAANLVDLLKKAWPEFAVHVARNGVEAAEHIAALEPDLAFLDIKMPGLTGREVAQDIEGAKRVVFVTAYDEFAVAAFEQQAFDYVLKPVKIDRLARTSSA